MIRILIFILSAVFIAGALTYLASMNGRVEAVAFDQRFDIHAGAFVVIIIMIAAALIFGVSLFKDVAAAPQKLRARHTEAKLTRGIEALTRGYEALAMGDAAGAQAQARLAERNLENPALTRLLAAQAAHVAGDGAAAEKSFAAMLEAPDTEFLGLRGLFLHASAQGDTARAQAYAERAFRLRPDAAWAFESVLALGLDRGAWGETRDLVASARKTGLLAADRAARAEAALLAADAYAAESSGDTTLALEEAEAALKLAPSYAPAAALAARLNAAAGKKARAAKWIEAAYAAAAHPALALEHDALYKEERIERRAEEMRRLAALNPGARESRLIEARQHVLQGRCAEAIGILEPLLLDAAYARDCALMAEAVAGAHGEAGEAPARAWLKRAASAPRDPTPGADGAFHFSREGWARLIREYMDFDRLSPPPLDAAPRGLSRDELRLLAAPTELEHPLPDEPAAPSAAEPREPIAAQTALEKVAEERARAISAAGQVS